MQIVYAVEVALLATAEKEIKNRDKQLEELKKVDVGKQNFEMARLQ